MHICKCTFFLRIDENDINGLNQWFNRGAVTHEVKGASRMTNIKNLRQNEDRNKKL